jgi:hypothetical protein
MYGRIPSKQILAFFQSAKKAGLISLPRMI